MNDEIRYKEQFIKCTSLLKDWSELLRIEALKHYPNHTHGPISGWVKELAQLSAKELWLFQNELDLTNIDDNSFKQLVLQINKLTTFPKKTFESHHFPKHLLRKVNPKKEHEIQSLMSLINEFEKVETIIDVGGGVGNLSRALVHEKNRRSFCIDFNRELQNSGSKRLEALDEATFRKIEFIHARFDDNFHLKELGSCKDRLVVGLHSCGSLGSDLIEFFSSNKYENLVLASCCYHKLDNKYNISTFAKSIGHSFSENSLHLASRCYRFETFDDFQNKLKLRGYRYALHLLDYKYGFKKFVSIGNTKISDYDLSFFEYAKKYSQTRSLDENEVVSFYENESTQKLVQEIILVDIIRALFGRLIETTLILDRAIYLEEQSYTVSIVEAFDRRMSPRNLVIHTAI